MKDEIISLIEEGGEFALDSILPDGIVRELPIISRWSCKPRDATEDNRLLGGINYGSDAPG